MQQEMAVEAIVLAEEIKTENAEQWQLIQKRSRMFRFVLFHMRHSKKKQRKAKPLFEQGSDTYSNIILQAAVIF